MEQGDANPPAMVDLTVPRRAVLRNHVLSNIEFDAMGSLINDVRFSTGDFYDSYPRGCSAFDWLTLDPIEFNTLECAPEVMHLTSGDWQNCYEDGMWVALPDNSFNCSFTHLPTNIWVDDLKLHPADVVFDLHDLRTLPFLQDARALGHVYDIPQQLFDGYGHVEPTPARFKFFHDHPSTPRDHGYTMINFSATSILCLKALCFYQAYTASRDWRMRDEHPHMAWYDRDGFLAEVMFVRETFREHFAQDNNVIVDYENLPFVLK